VSAVEYNTTVGNELGPNGPFQTGSWYAGKPVWRQRFVGAFPTGNTPLIVGASHLVEVRGEFFAGPTWVPFPYDAFSTAGFEAQLFRSVAGVINLSLAGFGIGNPIDISIDYTLL
jgi:hypothetical protein